MAWIGDANNMCYTWLQAAAQLGFDVPRRGPPGLRRRHRTRVDPVEAAQFRRVPGPACHACRDADLVTTDVWTSMGFEAENEARKRAFAQCRWTRR